jgi:hypothetical protein
VGLVRLACLLTPCPDWPAAAIVLRNAGVLEVAEAIEQGFRTHSVSLRQLWDFLAEEDFRTLLPEAQLQGPIGASYRALLAAAEPAHLGRHATLLHHDEVQKVFNLRMAQRQVVRAWKILYDRQPSLIGRALQREDHWLGYWSMVFLYTARRGTAGNRPAPTAREERPPRPMPEPARRQRAWAHAAFMDPLTVLHLLKESEAQATEFVFLCPRGWDRHRHWHTAPTPTNDSLV